MKIEDALGYTHVSLLKERADNSGDKPFYYFKHRKVNYRQFDERTNIIAKGLEKIGVAKGDRVGILLPNGDEVLESYYAIWKCGAISVSLNPMYTEREIQYVINDSGARHLITSNDFKARVETARPEMQSLLNIVMVSSEPIPDTIPYADLAVGFDGVGDKGIKPGDAAQIMYTSGTTGNPKGAVLPHNGVISVCSMISEAGYYTEDDCTLCALPFFHLFAILVMISNVAANGSGMVLHERFEPQTVLEDFGKYGVSVFFGVPTMYSFLLDAYDPVKHNMETLRLGVAGAAPVPVHVMREFEDKFDMTIIEGYGMTESCGGMMIERVEKERRSGSCGHVLPGLEVKIFDENDEEVPYGDVGEIVLRRGAICMQGYWNMPRANAETFRNGWLHTGDLGRQDEDGYFYIVDRLKDMIITGGFNIYPKEIEDIIYSHPAVLETTVIGAPDKVKGELAMAYVVLKQGESLDETELDAFCRGRLAAYKVPRRYQFASELPKNPQGKILKRVLRNELEDNA